MDFSHVSVMPEEALEYWVTSPVGTYVDGTAGGGGHDMLLLERYPEARLIAIDQDPNALSIVEDRLETFGHRVTCIGGNFRRMSDLIRSTGVAMVDGVLLDLGCPPRNLTYPNGAFPINTMPH